MDNNGSPSRSMAWLICVGWISVICENKIVAYSILQPVNTSLLEWVYSACMESPRFVLLPLLYVFGIGEVSYWRLCMLITAIRETNTANNVTTNKVRYVIFHSFQFESVWWIGCFSVSASWRYAMNSMGAWLQYVMWFSQLLESVMRSIMCGM